jgi:hypothetical protein
VSGDERELSEVGDEEGRRDETARGTAVDVFIATDEPGPAQTPSIGSKRDM